ncbi:MAG: hypothetical protein HDT28_04535 [Clostridiales bacterium]|nr:hypothetical protein [Clostridiales bacterium]
MSDIQDNNVLVPVSADDENKIVPTDGDINYSPAETASKLPEVAPEVRTIETPRDDSMHGGYASVNGKPVRYTENRMVWIVLIVMCIMCIAVGICSAVITAHFMRKGETPPVIDVNGEVQQNVSAVVSARKSGIVEVSCGTSKGSGIVMKRVGSDVYILTNAHMLANYVSLHRLPAVRFYGEDTFYESTVVGYDSLNDVAVLTVSHDTQFTVYDLEGSEYFSPDIKVAEGDYVVSIGNAMGLGVAVYEGVISREYELLECNNLFNEGGKKFVPVMRTTAVINAGMSGGGVFDMSGKLVGLGTYRMSNSVGVDVDGGSDTDVENTGFIVPMSVLYPVYKRIMATANGGEASMISVTAKSASSSAIGWLGLPFGFNCEYRNGKLTVASLDQNSPAKNISVGDVIEKIGDYTVTPNISDTIGAIISYHRSGTGKALTFTVRQSGGGTQTVTIENTFYAI